MADEALEEICGLVASVSVAKSLELSGRLEKLLAEYSDALHGSVDHKAILVTFACTNWNFANGVWSNLENVQLRRDLMAKSKNSLILALVATLAPSGDARDKAALAVHIDFDLFQPFLREYLKEAKTVEGGPDAIFALQFALGWIQKLNKIQDYAMSEILRRFLTEVGDFTEVEGIASQVNCAADLRKAKSLWSRFFGG